MSQTRTEFLRVPRARPRGRRRECVVRLPRTDRGGGVERLEQLVDLLPATVLMDGLDSDLVRPEFSIHSGGL